MVGSNGTMIAIRLVRSKLRKREDHHSEHPEQTVVQTATDNNLSNNNQTVLPESIIPPDSNHAYTNNAYTATTTSEQFVWQFPPPFPPPRINPSQYALYNEQVRTNPHFQNINTNQTIKQIATQMLKPSRFLSLNILRLALEFIFD